MDIQKINKIKQSLNNTRQKRKNQQCHVYSCKIQYNKLNNKQKQQLNKLFIEAKWLYNHVLNLHKNGLKFKQIDTKIIQIIRLDKNKNQIKSKLNQLSAAMKQSIVAQMNANQKTIISLIKKGYQTHGQLHFISSIKSIDLKQYNITHKISSKNKVKIQSISGQIKVKGLEQLKDYQIANAKLIKVSNRDYYLNITTYKPIQINKTNGSKIGIDFGCQNSFTLSNGQKLKVIIEESEKLKSLQRKLRRQIKGSNNYYKTLDKLHKEYSKIQFKKRDHINKLIHNLKQFKTIIIQDEQLSNWKRLGHGKAIQHSILGRVKAKLKLLPQTIVLDRFIPTSKYCSCCNSIIKYLKVYNRTFKCKKCNFIEDRDLNAAINMIKIY